MLLSALCLLVCATATVQGMSETCSAVGFSYRSGSHFYSTKDNGYRYKCRCIGDNCLRLVCSRVISIRPRTTTSTPEVVSATTPSDSGASDGGDAISGSVPSGSVPSGSVPSGSVPSGSQPIFIPSGGIGNPIRVNRHVCHYRGRTYQLRQTFNKVGPLLTCVCRLVGGAPEIRCGPPACDMPPMPTTAPSGSASFGQRITGCYDGWNEQWYADGETYNRTRKMTYDGSIMGVYTCTCQLNMMRCSAVDIPCCNTANAEFAAKGSTFVAMIPTANRDEYEKMRCTCFGGRASFRNCIPLGEVVYAGTSDSGYRTSSGTSGSRYSPSRGSSGGSRYTTSTGSSRRYPVYPARYPSSPTLNECYDRRTKTSHREGAIFNQDRGDAIYRCDCSIVGRKSRISCTFLRYKWQ